jgi:hypothetical protein
LPNNFVVVVVKNSFGSIMTSVPIPTRSGGAGATDEESRSQFEAMVFCDKSNSSQLTDEEWGQYVHLLQQWNREDDSEFDVKKFRRENKKQGYRVALKHHLKVVTIPNGEEKIELHRKTGFGDNRKTKARGTILLPRSKLFDAIKDCHLRLEHVGPRLLYQQLSKKYFNITRAYCTIYCSLCNICRAAKEKKPNLSNAVERTPVTQFRDCFHVCLIDMTNRVQMNPNGCQMKWMMTVMDQFTGFIWLSSLQEKKSEYIRYEMFNLFGHVGYPKVLLKGKEFTPEISLDFLNKHIPRIDSMISDSRNHRVQDPEEDARWLVLNALSFLEISEGNQNWTELLSSIALYLNSSPQKDVGKSSYEAVFGIPTFISETCFQPESVLKRNYFLSKRYKYPRHESCFLVVMERIKKRKETM